MKIGKNNFVVKVKTKDEEVLTASVRQAMSRNITVKYTDERGGVQVMTLSPQIEELISNSLLQTEQGVQLVMDPALAQDLIGQIAQTIESHPEVAGQPILLTSPTVRRHLYKLVSRFIPQLIVLSHSELTSEASVSSVGIVEMSHAS